uniref:GRAM domain-containing protein n=1 Tax=Macrostomum lignano TaxID=282301 RepID=A0A1I8HMP8_9PLAT
ESHNQPVFVLANPVLYLDTHYQPALNVNGRLTIGLANTVQTLKSSHGSSIEAKLAIQFTPEMCSYEAANLDQYAFCLLLKSLKGVTLSGESAGASSTGGGDQQQMASSATSASPGLRQLAMEDPFAGLSLVASGSEDGFEVLSTQPTLPATRPQVQRGQPVTLAECAAFLDVANGGGSDGESLMSSPTSSASTVVATAEQSAELKRRIFRGGIEPEARQL